MPHRNNIGAPTPACKVFLQSMRPFPKKLLKADRRFRFGFEISTEKTVGCARGPTERTDRPFGEGIAGMRMKHNLDHLLDENR
jgi:hypothetical protein